MNKTPTNLQIIASIEKGFVLERRSANPGTQFDTGALATHQGFFGSMTEYTSALSSMPRACCRVIRCSTTYEPLKMTKEEVSDRLQQIADANRGDWSARAHRVWVYHALDSPLTLTANSKSSNAIAFQAKFDYGPNLNSTQGLFVKEE